MAHVIVLDDDPSNSGLLKMLLELDGFSVTSCTDISQAIDASNEEVDAYVVDIHLARGSSGLDLLTMIRLNETDANPDCAVIMTSGDHRLEDEAKRLGASTFLLKPYSPDVLSSTLKELLA